MNIHENFIIEAHLLSRVNSEQWNKFMVSLYAYTKDIMEKAIMQQSPEVVGMAKQSLIFYKVLADLEQTYKKIKGLQQMTTPQNKTPIDTGVKMPEAVMRGAARAAELVEQQRTGKMAVVDINSSSPPIAPVTPTPTPSDVEIHPITPRDNKERHYSQQDFDAMQGRWQKSEQEKRDLANRVMETQRLLATLQTAPSVGRGDVQFQTPVSRKLIRDEEVKEYSPEFFDMIGRRAREVAEPEVAALRQEIEQLKRSVGGVQQNVVLTAQQKMYDELTKELPDWEQQNSDPAFYNDWLGQIDPLSGVPRKALLKNAFETGQTSRVIAAFKSYKAEQATSSPAQTGRSSPGNGAESPGSSSHLASAGNSRSNPATTPAVDLTALAAPGRARSGQTDTSPDKPIVERAEIAQFFADVTKGKYTGRDAEKDAIEKLIFEAQREGRIR